MKAFTSSLVLAILLLAPGLLRAEADIDTERAIIGTWVIDDAGSWAYFSKSPEWTQMTADQQVDFRATIWPKALEKLLFTAYHFSDGQIVIAHKDNQLRVPASYAAGDKNTLTVTMGEPPRTAQLTVTFLDADHVNIRAANEVKPNYYVWTRRGK